MKFIPKWNNADIDKIISEQIDRVKQAVIMRFQFIGERFVTNARLNGTYNDITANLRSSIGYVILKDGVQLFDNFQQAGKSVKGTGAGKGVKTAQTVAEGVASKYSKGLVLICVAGMEYAAAVEARGRDVITGSSLTAKTDLKNAIEQIQAKIRA